jgi:hypothetical protein
VPSILPLDVCARHSALSFLKSILCRTLLRSQASPLGAGPAFPPGTTARGSRPSRVDRQRPWRRRRQDAICAFGGPLRCRRRCLAESGAPCLFVCSAHPCGDGALGVDAHGVFGWNGAASAFLSSCRRLNGAEGRVGVNDVPAKDRLAEALAWEGRKVTTDKRGFQSHWLHFEPERRERYETNRSRNPATELD